MDNNITQLHQRLDVSTMKFYKIREHMEKYGWTGFKVITVLITTDKCDIEIERTFHG